MLFALVIRGTIEVKVNSKLDCILFFSETGSGETHLADVDAVVYGPCGLKALQHALFQGLRQAVNADEVLQVFGACVVKRAAGVHALDDGRHITEDYGMHQC